MATTKRQFCGPGALAITIMALLGVMGLVPQTSRAEDFGNPAFASAYNANPALWGTPGQILTEQYSNASNGQRQVQYFDKGRMELTYPVLQPGFVGDGKLVTEMVSGRMQVGDTLYWQYDGAESPVAGGPTFGSNPGAPSYRSFQSLTGVNLSRVGRAVTAVLNQPEGEGFLLGITSLSSDAALGTLARNTVYIAESGHNIPDVFWTYLNQNDANGLPAFDWQSIFGLPITDSYWAKVRNGGTVSDVLVQLFERRTLLFNPAAAPGTQVDSGLVGRDYYRWRYEQPELPVIDTTFSPPNNSANVTTVPSIAEAGATFRIRTTGFQPDETIKLYVRVQPDGGVYTLRDFKADGSGNLNIRTTTTPLQNSTEERYYVFTGQNSGQVLVAHLKIIGSERYTPAVEMVQPGDIPPGIAAAADRPVIRIGESTKLTAVGFAPNEYLKGWITTPLNRVVGWVGLINSNSTPKSYPFLLKAGSDGTIKMELPAPGVAEPGIYAFTLYGQTSNHTSIVYFRVKTGPATLFDPVWGRFDYDVQPRPAEAKPVDVTTLAQQRFLNPHSVRVMEVEQEQ